MYRGRNLFWTHCAYVTALHQESVLKVKGVIFADFEKKMNWTKWLRPRTQRSLTHPASPGFARELRWPVYTLLDTSPNFFFVG